MFVSMLTADMLLRGERRMLEYKEQHAIHFLPGILSTKVLCGYGGVISFDNLDTVVLSRLRVVRPASASDGIPLITVDISKVTCPRCLLEWWRAGKQVSLAEPSEVLA
jgi:hypothetical protein